jgi:hypothetical protein
MAGFCSTVRTDAAKADVEAMILGAKAISE